MPAMRSDWAAPLRWGDHVSAPAAFSSEGCGWTGALVRSWRGTAPDMDMPPLDHHLVVLHGGGPKSMTRHRDGRSRTVDAASGAVSVIPAGNGHTWATRGPIAFTHLYLAPAMLERAVAEVFDRNPTMVHLSDELGRSEPLLSSLLEGLSRALAEGETGAPLYLDALLDALSVTLLRRCSNLATVSARRPHAMAPRRLKRVLDYMEARLGEPVTLDDLAETAGMSRFHFSRVFREETGASPYAHLLTRRVEAAKSMLVDPAMSLDEVVRRTGFSSSKRFGATFRRVTGRTPGQYRRDHN